MSTLPMLAKFTGFKTLTRSYRVYKIVKERNPDRDMPWQRWLVELELPKGTIIYCKHSITGLPHAHKCRASQAIPRRCWRLDTGEFDDRVTELHHCRVHNHDFFYKFNEVIKPQHDFCMKPMTCQSGIHFFRTPGQCKYWYKSTYSYPNLVRKA